MLYNYVYAIYMHFAANTGYKVSYFYVLFCCLNTYLTFTYMLIINVYIHSKKYICVCVYKNNNSKTHRFG